MCIRDRHWSIKWAFYALFCVTETLILSSVHKILHATHAEKVWMTTLVHRLVAISHLICISRIIYCFFFRFFQISMFQFYDFQLMEENLETKNLLIVYLVCRPILFFSFLFFVLQVNEFSIFKSSRTDQFSYQFCDFSIAISHLICTSCMI